MKSNRILKTLVVGASLPLLFLADVSPESPFGVTLVRQAHAIVGAPMTPMSVAGVARRTTARVVVAETATVAATSSAQQAAVAQQQAATAQQQQAVAKQQAATAQQQAAAAVTAGAPAVGTIVNALPAGCVQEAKGGVEYQKCGNVYFRAAFQGNNLVYVVQQP